MTGTVGHAISTKPTLAAMETGATGGHSKVNRGPKIPCQIKGRKQPRTRRFSTKYSIAELLEHVAGGAGQAMR